MTVRESVLVTGASGFVGSAIANAARARGWRVRALVRVTSPRRNLNPADEIVIGDLNDRASLAAALKGMNYLFHAAADYRLWAADPGEIMRTNVDGTERLMNEALKAGVERIVYTSSVATLRVGEPDPADESRPMALDDAVGAYKRSKIGAERLVEAMARQCGLPAVIVNPSTPIGPCDIRPTPTGRIILEAARGRLPAFVETGLNFVHVDDVADGHIAALERGRIGERYILGGDNVPLSQLLAEIAALVRRRAPTIRLPHELAYAFASAAEIRARFSGREPLATRDGVRLSRQHMYFNDSKARAELGHRSRPHADGLADAIA